MTPEQEASDLIRYIIGAKNDPKRNIKKSVKRLDQLAKECPKARRIRNYFMDSVNKRLENE